MENVMKELEAIMFDAKQAASRAGEYRKDIECGINVNHTAQQEQEPKGKTVERLFDYLIEASSDMERVKEDLQDINSKLDALMEMLDYERVRKEAGL